MSTARRRNRRRRQRLGLGLITAGTVLLVLAVALYATQMWRAYRAGNAAEDALEEVQTLVEENRDSGDGADAPDYAGNGFYLGILRVPDLGMELPVLTEWSYDNLDIAPCRYAGSVAEGNLVICGHNYRRHFSPLKTVPAGTEVIFSDIYGHEYHYEVIRTETVRPTQIAEMVGDGDTDWDMTLFTCTTGGQARCAVRCARTE